MDIVAVFAPPRMCQLAGRPYWVRPMTLEGFATLIAWLDDVLPGRHERTLAPPLSSPEAQAAIQSRHGLVLLAWLALKDQGVDYAGAADLVMAAGEDELGRLVDVMFARRRYMGTGHGGGDDLAASWFGPGMIAMSERVATLVGTIGRLTLDQLDCYATDGAPAERPGRLTTEQVQAMWEASMASTRANGSGATE